MFILKNKSSKDYCQTTIRLDTETFELIKQLKKETGLSSKEILSYSSKPCDCCKAELVLAWNSKDKSVKIKRGILFQSMLKKNSTYDVSKKSGWIPHSVRSKKNKEL